MIYTINRWCSINCGKLDYFSFVPYNFIFKLKNDVDIPAYLYQRKYYWSYKSSIYDISDIFE